MKAAHRDISVSGRGQLWSRNRSRPDRCLRLSAIDLQDLGYDKSTLDGSTQALCCDERRYWYIRIERIIALETLSFRVRRRRLGVQRRRLLLDLSMVSLHDDSDDMVLVRSPEETVVVAKEKSGCLQVILMVWQCGS